MRFKSLNFQKFQLKLLFLKLYLSYTINFFYKIFYKENYSMIFFIHTIIFYIPEAGWFEDPTEDNSNEKEEES